MKNFFIGVGIICLVVLPFLFFLFNGEAILEGEFTNLIKCKISFGDWVEHRGGWVTLYECGFDKTPDGGKTCLTSTDCVFDCVVSEPASDHFSFSVEKKGNDYYYVSGEAGICQTHERFLNNKTYRVLFENKILLTPDDPDYEILIKDL